MKIRQLSVIDIPEIVKLHRQCLPNTTTSKLGLEYITNIYSKMLGHPKHHLLLGMEVDNHIVGVLTATNDLSWTMSCVSPSVGGSDMVHILKQIILGNVPFFQLIQRWRFEKTILHRFPHPFTTILTVFTHPAYQRKGIAKELVKGAISWSRKQNSATLYVDTEEQNRIARKFYEHLGFIQEATILGEVVLAIQP